ncbi:glycosyltransferase family 1 protein [Lutibacter sp. B2]|nr:glycosyltransferase family 1 protein [Lutibacter sp. B2]
MIKRKIVIKVPVAKWSNAHLWGDYHFALAIKKQFERKNWKVLIQIYPEWNTKDDSSYDVVIVLRGLQRYMPKRNHFNIMWNISHPDDVMVEEYNNYDYVFIASNIWAEHISSLCDVKVEAMLQCTDSGLFYLEESMKYKHELLFIGNSRKVFRKIIKDILPTNRDLSVYGTCWNEFINKKYIKGRYISNKELRKVYSSCKILLNDHWDDMRKKGFLSNRLFDGYASGAFIISDNIKGYKEVFGDALVTYKTKEELDSLIEKYLKNEILRKEKARKGYEIVNRKHTFKKRVERIIEVIERNI